MEYTSLEKELLSLNSEDGVQSFIDRHCNKSLTLQEVLNKYIASRDIPLSLLMKRSRINRNYGYNIINGRRSNPGRDKVVALCIALGLSIPETQEVLLLSKVGGLYLQNPRDVWIAFCLNTQVVDVLDVNILLESKSVQPLDV